MSTSIPGVHDVIRFHDPLTQDHDPVIAHAQRIVNKALAGRLEVDFDTRQITLTNIHGNDALRFHKIISDYREGDPSSARWADQLDPRTSDAGDGWITFDVKRVIAVRWFPERLVLGDKDRRHLLWAAIRLVTNKPNLSDPASLSTQEVDDCTDILIDMGRFDTEQPVDQDDDDGDGSDVPADEAGDDDEDVSAADDADLPPPPPTGAADPTAES